jgi:hypothetical protein
VVQGQIGGESRPGSASAIRKREKRFLYNSASCCAEQPSGRPLEPRREPWPRGMIAARALHAAQNPAYRLTRYFLNELQDLDFHLVLPSSFRVRSKALNS